MYFYIYMYILYTIHEKEYKSTYNYKNKYKTADDLERERIFNIYSEQTNISNKFNN